MSAFRIGASGDVVFECDDCGELLETGCDDFTDAREVLRDEGWEPKKAGDVWTHYCEGCHAALR